MPTKRIISVLYFLIVFAGECLTQQVRFDHFDISNELSQNNIIQLLVDDVGYIWAGTLEGLNRFDGYKFKVFKPYPDSSGTISGSEIIALGKSNKGDIWVVTKNGGLNFYNSEQNTFQIHPDSLFAGFNLENTNIIVEDSEGKVWLSDTTSIGIFNPETLKFDLVNTGYSVASMIGLPGSEMIIAGQDGVFEISKKGMKPLYSHPVYMLALDRDGSVYGVNNNHLLRWTDVYKEPDIILHIKDLELADFSAESLLDMTVRNNEVWFAGSFPLIRIGFEEKDAILYKYDSNNSFSFQGRRAKDLVFDKNDNLWIGTSKHGLNLLGKQKNQFQHYHWGMTTDNTLDIDPVRCICKTQSGDLWFSFDRFGVGVQHPNGDQELYTRFHDIDESIRDINRVRSIFQDSHGNIWIGDHAGMGIFNPSKNRIESVRFKFNWDWPFFCYAIKEMDPGILTITGSPNNIGFVDLSSGTLKKLILSRNGESVCKNIREIVKDQDHNYWIGHSEGLIRIDYPSLEYSIIDKGENTLNGIKIYSMYPCRDSIWIGTNTGLHVFSIEKNRVVKSFLEEDGLVNNIIYSVNSDTDGKIWISANNGISCFDAKNHRFSNFLENDFFMDDAHFKDKDGNLYYGGYTGVVSFTPELMTSQELVPQPSFEEFYLFNRQVSPGEILNNRIILEKSISKTEYIRLHHQQNSISFSFNAFPFNFPNENRFRYKLDRLQEEWTYPAGSNRLATFTNLNPGKYVLQLSASSGIGEWSKSKELIIEIIPPFWRTSWFRYSMIFLLFLTVYLIYLQRISAIKKHNILLKQKVDEQTSALKEQNREIEEMAIQLHESDEAKLRFFTNISHEFRTPLTLILGYADQLEGKQLKHSSKAIKNGAMKLLRLVNQLIDLRKLDQDKMQLSVNGFDLVEFTRDIVDSFQIASSRKDLDLQFISSTEHLNVWLDIDKMDKILYNLITNAIKYTPKGRGIVVSVVERTDYVELSVSDQGVGIPKEDIDHIFTRFFRSQEHKIEGHGIGLSYVRSLVEIQKGEISVRSEVNKGSEFILKFKKGKDHLKAESLEIVTPVIQDVDMEEIVIDDWQPFNPGVELLIVEDNDDLRDFLKDLLSAYYNVLTADNGIEAMEVLENASPQLIISDIMMPGMDGITFCQKVKQDTATSHIPLILLTAKSEIESKVEGFESGADAYVEKPFNSQLLLIQINSILENRDKLRNLFLEHGTGLESIKDKISKADKQFWLRISRYIHTELSSPDFSVEDMSREMNMSRASFYRKFKGLTGISPGDYLRKSRLQKSKTLLLEDDSGISRIAMEVGFQSVSHFRKSFKEEFGSTPGEWRKSGA